MAMHTDPRGHELADKAAARDDDRARRAHAGGVGCLR